MWVNLFLNRKNWACIINLAKNPWRTCLWWDGYREGPNTSHVTEAVALESDTDAVLKCLTTHPVRGILYLKPVMTAVIHLRGRLKDDLMLFIKNALHIHNLCPSLSYVIAKVTEAICLPKGATVLNQIQQNKTCYCTWISLNKPFNNNLFLPFLCVWMFWMMVLGKTQSRTFDKPVTTTWK